MSEFVFDLALALGCSLPAVLGMTSREFGCWVARFGREPFGDARRDVMAAQAPFVLASVHRGKNGRKPRLDDFLPFRRKRARKAMSEEAIVAALNSFAGAA